MPEGGNEVSLKELLEKKIVEVRARLHQLTELLFNQTSAYRHDCQTVQQTELMNPDEKKIRLEKLESEYDKARYALMQEKANLEAGLELIGKFSPYLQVVKDLRVDLYPIIDALAKELRGDLVHIGSTVFVDMVLGTIIEIGKEAEKKEYASEAAGLWARGVRRKYDALCAAGFSGDEAMRIVLATMNGGSDETINFGKALIGSVMKR